jgi:hypothetical protein
MEWVTARFSVASCRMILPRLGTLAYAEPGVSGIRLALLGESFFGGTDTGANVLPDKPGSGVTDDFFLGERQGTSVRGIPAWLGSGFDV